MNSRKMCQSVIVLCAALLASAWADVSNPANPLVFQVALSDQPITPVTARFIERTLGQAQAGNAECFILELDTPGGLMTSTHQIVKDILNSSVPVVVYVSPSGGRAASAGVFITLASHVAVMAPGTHIGAAHPVQIGPVPTTPQQPASEERKKQSDPNTSVVSPLAEKQVNDAVAWVRSLAQMRDRNADWAAKAVSESSSITATEAEKEKVIDFLAVDIEELLTKLDGRHVMVNHQDIQLQTAGANVEHVSMWWGENVLIILSNPNVAFLLLILGFYGVLFELHTPGWGVSGTLGAICLMLGFFGLSVLPINITGLLLIVAALALFVAEAFVTSYGALTFGGVICLVLGGVMLVDTPVPMMRVSLGLLIPIALATAAITVFLVVNIIRGHRRNVQTGFEAMVGKQATAAEAFSKKENVYIGTVWVHGEYWKAQSSEPVFAGQTVTIQNQRGLMLYVSVAGNVSASAQE